LITISEIVKQIVIKSPFLEEGLSEGLINCSALARKLKPDIESKLYRSVQMSAIIMALSRFSQNLTITNEKNDRLRDVLSNINDISLRSHLTVFTFVKSMTITAKKVKLSEVLFKNPYCFIEIMDGIYENVFYVSSEIESEFSDIFLGESLTSKIENISAITIRIPREAIDVPGVYYVILKKLAWDGVNIIDIMSSFTELTIFVDSKNVNSAFISIKQ